MSNNAPVREGDKIRASWSEDIRHNGRRIYVSTAIEREVGVRETLETATRSLMIAMMNTHEYNIETATGKGE